MVIRAAPVTGKGAEEMKAFNFAEQKCTMMLSVMRAKLDSLDDVRLDFGSFRDEYLNIDSLSDGQLGEAARGVSMEQLFLLALAAVIAAALIALFVTSTSRKREALEKRFSEYDLLAEKMERSIRDCTEELVVVKNRKAQISSMDTADVKLKGMSHFDDIVKEVSMARTELKDNADQIMTIRKNRKNVGISLKAMNELYKKSSRTEKNLERDLTELREANQADARRIMPDIERVVQAGSRISDSAIKCDLKISDISTLSGVTGMMSARNFAGEYRQGSFSLDDIPLLGREGKLGSPENLGPTGLYVSGLNDGRGLLLCGSEPFSIRYPGRGNVSSDKAELISGNVYELTARTGKGKARMKLIVQ